MKKIFIFIFLLFSIIFFSSCHDDGLSGIIDKSDLKTRTNDQTTKVASTPSTSQTNDQTTKVASTPSTSQSEDEETPSRLEEMMRNDPNFRKIIELLNSTAEGMESSST
ncbi:hypothetical protein [Blattabacterium cuenoti]|uniref:hypothetical protein n=1 Tax=Blattabacterium cuenoti TaxID=1653831 RepID=UPI00311D9B7F